MCSEEEQVLYTIGFNDSPPLHDMEWWIVGHKQTADGTCEAEDHCQVEPGPSEQALGAIALLLHLAQVARRISLLLTLSLGARCLEGGYPPRVATERDVSEVMCVGRVCRYPITTFHIMTCHIMQYRATE